MTDKVLTPYILTGPYREQNGELIFDGMDGAGSIAFAMDQVEPGPNGVTVHPDVRPRLVRAPTRTDASVIQMTGLYCICIGQACYTYQCSDNKYLGECGPVPCSYYGCKS